ncbi:MAG: leucine-rich repeat domain-containing protein, partial [Oscillospiraceae bacterium]|nr:leucine-rich repeat domain-containing protein [Oscillospiraceae bacterium]
MKIKKLIAAVTALNLIAGNYYAGPASYSVRAESGDTDIISAAEEAEEKVTASQNLPVPSDNIKYHLINYSNLVPADDGYMRVFYDDKISEGSVSVEYYDREFNFISAKSIEMELSIWGGFFCGSDAYYLIEGENNTAEDTAAEVIRVIKYDREWNRIGASNVTGDSKFGHQVRYPFDYGCVKATEHNGKLYVVTGHEGYVDASVGQGHQGFLMITVDEETLEGKITDADLWHSFAQYIVSDKSALYVLEQSEGSGYTKLTRYDSETMKDESVKVLEYGGDRSSVWAVPCYATVDEIALSADNILCAGTSIDQSMYDSSNSVPYNIYLTVTPKNKFSGEATNVIWLTDFADEKVTFSGLNLTRINDDRFMLSWGVKNEQPEGETDGNDVLSGYVLHYVFIDGAGNKISEEFTENAPVSDCEPVFNGSEIVYYASNGSTVNFYSVNAETGAFSKRMYHVIGDHAEWSFEGNTLTISGTGELKAPSGGSSYSYISTWANLNDKIETLVIEEGIENIPENIFRRLTSLKEVKIPGTVKSIGKNAFSNCSSLESIVIPDGVETIEEQAFYECENLKRVVIPESVKEIGEDILWTGYYWLSDDSHVYNAVIYAPEDSYAYQYAKENKITYRQYYDWIPLTAEDFDAFAEENGITSVRGKYIVYCDKTDGYSYVSTGSSRSGAFSNAEKYSAGQSADDTAVRTVYVYEALIPGNVKFTIQQLVSGEDEKTVSDETYIINEDLSILVITQFAASRADKISYVKSLAEKKDSAECTGLISEAVSELEGLEYDTEKSMDENLELIDSVVSVYEESLAAQRAEDKLKADMADFEEYKADSVKTVKAMLLETDSEACAELIESAVASIEGLEYDAEKTLEENIAATVPVITDI